MNRIMHVFPAFIGLITVTPILLVVMVAFTNKGFISLPERLSWRWFDAMAERPEFVNGFVNSFVLAAITSVAVVILGTLAVMALRRMSGVSRQVILGYLMSPLMIPQILFGLAFLQFATSYGLRNSLLRFSLAHIVVTLPFVVRTILGVVESIGEDLEDAASTLGASSGRVFWTITLPLIRPALIAGGVFAFLMSLDNVTVSLFLTTTQFVTLPVQIYTMADLEYTPLLAAVSTVLVVITVAAALTMHRFFGLDRLMTGSLGTPREER